MKKNKTICTILMTVFTSGVLALSSPTISQGTPLYYTDFAAFDAATTTTIVEDFEAFSQKGTLLASFESNGNTYTAFAGSPSINVVVASPICTNFGVPTTESSVLTANGDEDFSIEFGAPTHVLGFDTYLNEDGPAIIQIFGSGNLLLDTYSLEHDPTQVGFFGIIANESIHSIRWTTTNGRVVNTGIDNIRQGSAAVPEPASIVFVCIGLLAMGAGKLRRKKK